MAKQKSLTLGRAGYPEHDDIVVSISYPTIMEPEAIDLAYVLARAFAKHSKDQIEVRFRATDTIDGTPKKKKK